VDDASPELKAIRDRLRKQRTRLRGTLESYLRGKDTAKYLQQQIVTDRNGRYVLVVRSEHRSAIPGIVHGSSGTARASTSSRSAPSRSTTTSSRSNSRRRRRSIGSCSR
jgi:dsDNA-specific endonuclease/ATPase MutS2